MHQGRDGQGGREGRAPLGHRAWKWFLAWEAVLLFVYFPFGVPAGPGRIIGAVPWMEWAGQVPAWALLGLSAVAAIAYGAYRHRPRAPAAWGLIGAGFLFFITGDTIYKTWHQLMGQQHIPSPSFVDAFYIAMYPALAVGLLVLARSRLPGGDQASLLDSLIITTGIGLISWIFLIEPNVRATAGLLARLTAVAYPLGDILLLAMLAHLWTAGGLANPAGRLLAVGTCGTLIADSVYGLAGLHSSWNWHDGNPFDVGWALFYGCWGAAALHPSMRELSQRAPVVLHRTSRARLTLLGAVSLIAPLALMAEAVSGSMEDSGPIATVAAVLFLLVVMRMSGVVAAHQQVVAREQVLRREAASLVAAPGVTAIHEATVRGVKEIVGGYAGTFSVALAVAGIGEELKVVAGFDGDGRAGTPDISALLPEAQESIATRKALRRHRPAVGLPVGERPPPSHLFICPVAGSDRTTGVVVVASSLEVPLEVTNVVETLSSQAGVALDREELTASVHARRSEARLQTLVQNASDVILITRPDTTISYHTPSAERALGYAPQGLEGKRFTWLLHPSDRERALAAYGGAALHSGTSWAAECRVRHADGTWRNVEVVANNLLSDATVEGIVLTLRDVTERRKLEEELKHQAFHDALTGLANRALFRDRLEHALARANRSLTSLAVLFIDLDDFKLVNETLGHSAGDCLLVSVAARLEGSLRTGDTAARFGGDEFAVLLEETAGPGDAEQAAERVLSDLKAPFHIDERAVTVYASIGVAYSKVGSEGAVELLRAADVAMYAAKARGKDCYETYRPALQAAVSARLEKTAELQRALDEGEFVLHYQPIVELDGSGTVGVEALVRWQHPRLGLVAPNDFIPLAEETGLVVPMERWVLEEACRQARKWQDELGLEGDLRVSVNISARHFQHEGLLGDVSRALRMAQLKPGSLVLEITESLLVHDAEAVIARMAQLKSLGVAFAVDDFGTGYSSLSYLQRFPIDILKVDKSFVDGVGGSARALALAKAIVQLGKSLNLDTVAEGIEQPVQAEGLRMLGCRYGQGFLFARPAPATEMGGLLPRLTATASRGGSPTSTEGRPA